MTAQNGNPAGGDTPDGARSNRNTREQTSPKLFCNASGRLFHEEIKAIEREWARGNMDVASDNDRAWFEANPTRRYRLRGPLPGEHWHWRGDLTRASAVLVHSLAPGVRVRTPITLTLPLVLCRDDEATAKSLWEGVAR